MVNTVRGFNFGRAKRNKMPYETDLVFHRRVVAESTDDMIARPVLFFKVKLFVVKTQYQSPHRHFLYEYRRTSNKRY